MEESTGVVGSALPGAPNRDSTTGQVYGIVCDQAAPLDGLAQDYLSGIQNLLEAPWAVAPTDFVYPQTRGAPARPREKASIWRRAHPPCG